MIKKGREGRRKGGCRGGLREEKRKGEFESTEMV